MASCKESPNILITGTPGVGKSSIAKKVSEKAEMRWFDVSKLAVEKHMVEEFDENLSCPIIDEDKIIKFIKPKVKKGGCILDFYSPDIFPEEWIDVVFVIQTENKVLYDRLTERGYEGDKLTNNMEYELYGVALEEAKEAYDPDIVHALENNSEEQLNDTVDRICKWIDNWKKDNS